MYLDEPLVHEHRACSTLRSDPKPDRLTITCIRASCYVDSFMTARCV